MECGAIGLELVRFQLADLVEGRNQFLVMRALWFRLVAVESSPGVASKRSKRGCLFKGMTEHLAKLDFKFGKGKKLKPTGRKVGDLMTKSSISYESLVALDKNTRKFKGFLVSKGPIVGFVLS